MSLLFHSSHAVVNSAGGGGDGDRGKDGSVSAEQ